MRVSIGGHPFLPRHVNKAKVDHEVTDLTRRIKIGTTIFWRWQPDRIGPVELLGQRSELKVKIAESLLRRPDILAKSGNKPIWVSKFSRSNRCCRAWFTGEEYVKITAFEVGGESVPMLSSLSIWKRRIGDGF